MPLPQQQPVAAPARAVVGHKRALLVCVFVAAMTGRLYFETQYRQQIMQQQQRPQSYTADEDDTMLLHTATPRPEDSATPTTSAAAAGDATGDIGGVTTRNDDRQPARMKPSTSTSTTKTKQLKKKKKFFALHIGPSKTGTSTIQKDSGANIGFQQALQNDTTLYIGKFLTNQTAWRLWHDSIKCMQEQIRLQESLENQTNGTATRKKNENRNDNEHNTGSMTGTDAMNTRPDFLETCFKTNKYQLEMNILDSDEGHSYMGHSYEGGIQFQRKIHDLRVLYVDYLQYDEFIVVGAYRRFYNWLPSAHREYMKNHCFAYGYSKSRGRKDSSRQNACQSIWQYIHPNLRTFEERNKTNEERSQQYNTKHYHNIHETIPLARTVLLSANTSTNTNNNNKVEILNYFQLPNTNTDRDNADDTDNDDDDAKQYGFGGGYNSISTELYCKVLGIHRTPNTCKYSRDLGTNVVIHHKGIVDDIPYKLIMFEAYRRDWVHAYPPNSKWYNTTWNTRRGQKKRTETATNAMSNSTIQLWEDLKEYHMQVVHGGEEAIQQKKVQKNKESEGSFLVLPLLCPTRKRLEQLLLMSLRLEQLILPDFYNSTLGKEALVTDFWNSADQGRISDTNQFCSVNIPELFGTATSWEEVLTDRMTIQSW